VRNIIFDSKHVNPKSAIYRVVLPNENTKYNSKRNC